MSKATQIRKVTFAVHGLQGLLVFITFIMLLVIKAQKGDGPGQINFMFAMCFLSVPPIVFLSMSPKFERTKRFAHPIAFLVVGVLFSLFWFASFVALAVVNNRGITNGEKEKPENDGKGCAVTTIGTPKICSLSKGAIGLGVATFLAFGVTTGFAIYTVIHLQKNHLPWDYFVTRANTSHAVAADIEATTQDAFSHKMDQQPYGSNNEDDDTHGTGAYAPLAGHTGPQGHDEDSHGAVGVAPGGRQPHEMPYQRYEYDDEDTSYGGAGGLQNPNQARPPRYDANSPINFPHGPY